MNLNLKIKSSDVLDKVKDKIKKKLEDDLRLAVKTLGVGALRKAESLSEENLSPSLNNIYKDSLYIQNVSENIVEIGIREQALWIEEGRKSGFMDELLDQKGGSSVKTSKDGNKYRVIPMEKGGSGKNLSKSGDDLLNELKGFFKSQGIRYSKTRALELDDKGSPRVGKIHSFNIKDMRSKNKKSVQKLSRNLQGVSVYQSMNEKSGRVERNIMTFRVISEKNKGDGKWNHPGRPAEKILDKTFEWVQQTWEREILPELRKKYGSK